MPEAPLPRPGARRRFDACQGPRIVGPADGPAVDLGSVGVRFMVWAEELGGGFSVVGHPIPPWALAAPLHRHANEDEYSYVLEGRLGALLGKEHGLWSPEMSSSAPCLAGRIVGCVTGLPLGCAPPRDTAAV